MGEVGWAGRPPDAIAGHTVLSQRERRDIIIRMIGITRYGWREVAVGTVLWLGLSAACCTLVPHGWIASIALTLIWVWLLAFFRDPPRTIPTGPGLLIAPADGKITDITELETAEYIDGPAIRIGIFLNVFNVHINRAPCDGVVEYLHYQRGRKLNAMNPDAATVNESQAIGLRDTDAGKLLVRQICGLIARRIVCDLTEGDRLERGQVFGMIKFGSRTELIIPASAVVLVDVKVGQKVRGGRDVLARITDVLANKEARVQSAETVA